MPDDTFKEFVLDQLGALPEFAERGFGNALKRQVWLRRSPRRAAQQKAAGTVARHGGVFSL
jgi:hypothetical protein